MDRSESINELATALAQAQGKFHGIAKDAKNPHLKNQYTSLDAIINGIREPMSEAGLSCMQLVSDDGPEILLTTILLHASGQFISSTLGFTVGDAKGPISAVQEMGKTVTYLRRYALSAMLGIASETDDDGNGHKPAPHKQKQAKAAFKTTAQPPAGTRPLSAELVRDVCRKKAGWVDGKRVDGEPITDGQVKSIPGLLEKATPNLDLHDKSKARHDVLAYLFGAPVKSTHNLTKAEASAVISWLKEDGDGWDVNEYAEAEVAAVLAAVAVEAGQQEMELEAA